MFNCIDRGNGCNGNLYTVGFFEAEQCRLHPCSADGFNIEFALCGCDRSVGYP